VETRLQALIASDLAALAAIEGIQARDRRAVSSLDADYVIITDGCYVV
jgi:hypothetical protein